MNATALVLRRTDASPQANKACDESRVLANANCPRNAKPTAELDARTRMLLEHPIAPLILRLALPNATVMLVQILIG
ncbi:MAG: hypothetical protein V7632_544, partial [Bradyrhizobium sp.]